MAKLIAERSDTLPALGEVFREYGFSGASLSVISKATGLGKGSLYNFFPGGKTEMLEAILIQIEAWFENEVFSVLRSDREWRERIEHMLCAVEDYFNTGHRVCLVGALALNDPDDRFSKATKRYFKTWIKDLTQAFKEGGHGDPGKAALNSVVAIQGAIILTRALDDKKVFTATLEKIRRDYLVHDF